MASLQNSAGRYVGSSFTIKNILNLPEHESNGNEKVSQFSRSTLVSSPTRLVHGLALNTSPDKYRPRGSWPDDRVFFGKQPSWNMATSIASHTFLLGKWSRNSRLCLRKVNCSSKFVFPRFYIGLYYFVVSAILDQLRFFTYCSTCSYTLFQKCAFLSQHVPSNVKFRFFSKASNFNPKLIPFRASKCHCD